MLPAFTSSSTLHFTPPLAATVLLTWKVNESEAPRARVRVGGDTFTDTAGMVTVVVPLSALSAWLAARTVTVADEVKDPVIAQFALWTTLGHREVRQDKCLELRFGELNRNRCRYRLWCCCTASGNDLTRSMVA